MKQKEQPKTEEVTFKEIKMQSQSFSMLHMIQAQRNSGGQRQEMDEKKE